MGGKCSAYDLVCKSKKAGDEEWGAILVGGNGERNTRFHHEEHEEHEEGTPY